MVNATSRLRRGRAPAGPSDLQQRLYAVEREFAGRLRAASDAERRALYGQLYRERLERVPDHPLLEQAADPSARAAAAAMQVRLLRRLCGPGDTLVEVGPGDCEVGVQMAVLVRQVVGVDVTTGLLLRDELPENFELRVFDGLELPLEPSSVDCVYANQVLEHLHERDAAVQLASAFRALRPGGRCLYITPNRLSGPWDVSRHFTDSATGLHLREYTLSEQAALLRRAGFARVRAIVSVGGHVAPIRVPLRAIAAAERAIAPLPTRWRRPAATPLTAIKLVATKA